MLKDKIFPFLISFGLLGCSNPPHSVSDQYASNDTPILTGGQDAHLMAPDPLVIKKTPEDAIVYFSADSIKLRRDQELVLDEKIIKILKENPEFKVELYGYANDKGEAVSNQNIAKKRTAEVKKYLKINGIVMTRIKTSSEGVAFNSNDQAKSNEARNGRVVTVKIIK